MHVRLDDAFPAELRRNPNSKGRTIGAIVREANSDERKRTALARARARIADHLLSQESRQTIASLRLARGLSQSQLADLLGVSQSYVGKIESGRNSDLRATTIRRLAQALEVDGNTILGALSLCDEEACA